MKMKQFVGHAPKPPNLLCNQTPYDLHQESRAAVPESPMMRGIYIYTCYIIVISSCYYRNEPSLSHS